MKTAQKTFSKRRYRFFQAGFFILLFLLGFTAYANYDYWVFKYLIADHYIFTDALDTLYDAQLGGENVKGYRRDFDRVVIAAVTEKIRAVNRDGYTYLYTPEGYETSRETEKTDAKRAYIEALPVPGAVYLYLPNISKLTREFVYDNRAELAGYDRLVLDLRGNYGGLLNDFYRIADLFTEKGAVLGHEQTRLPFLTHAVKAKSDIYFHFDTIIILQDERTASAAEGLIQALKQQVPGVVLAGEKTFGKGIGQVTVPLTGGYAVRATVLLVQGPDGGTVHQTGIEPDFRAAGEDPLALALRLLEN